MESDFEALSGKITVRNVDGRFRPIATPAGFTDTGFRNAVAAFDTAYRTLGRLPSVEEVHTVFPKLPIITYATLFSTPEFKQALEYRGVQWTNDIGLSMEQSMALLKLCDPTDFRTTSVKLKELGVPMARYQAWMLNPLFLHSYKERSERGLKEAVPMVLQKLIGRAEASDQRAIEKVLEITGRWNPQAQQVEDARTVVLKVIEAVIKHVTDPEVRKAIMADVALTAGTLGALQTNNILEG